jgi:hypothetical protein
MRSLSNAFTSAFKELEPIPAYRATARILGSLKAVVFVATPHAGSGRHGFIEFTLPRMMARPAVTGDEPEHAAAPCAT